MKVILNGESFDCEEGLTVEELVKQHRLAVEATLVERNGVAIHRRDWTTRKLLENDRIEILSVAAGG
jgi:sulfur carrier protein